MARAHTTSPVVDSYGHPVGGARVEAYDVTDDSLLETQYTAATGIATFAALHDTHDADLKITWGLFHVEWRRLIFETGGGGGDPAADHGLLAGLLDDDHTQYIKHSLATAVNDFLAASGRGAFVKKTLAQTLTILGKAAASGLASLNASSKVVQQPAAITDHLENPPTEDVAAKAPTSEYAYDTKVQMIDGPLSPMILTGGLISEGTEGTVTISALTALLRTGSGDADPLTYVTLAEQANQTMVAADTKYHIVLKTYASPAIAIQETQANGTTEIGLGICMKDTSDPVKVHFQNTGMRLQGGLAKLHKRAATLRASELASGCGIADVGGGSRQFTIATGVVYHGIHRLTPFADAPYNPFNSNDDKFTYIYGDSTNGFTFSDGTDTVINNTQYYDGAGALATLGTNKYGCHWVYIHPDENHVYVVYGTTNGKLAEAEQAFAPSDLPIELDEFGLLLGCIIIKKDATAFTTIQMVTDTFFTGTAVADHGSLGGLDDEADHPYALLKDGTRNLEGNLGVDAGVTIDGVDVGAHHSRHEFGGADALAIQSLFLNNAKAFYHKQWDNSDGWTENVDAGGSASYSGLKLDLVCNSATNNEAQVYLTNPIDYRGNSTWCRKWSIRINLRGADWLGQTVYIGEWQDATDLGQNKNHIGFVIKTDGNLFATSGNDDGGGSFEETDTGKDAAEYANWDLMVITSPTEKERLFYVDGTLVATHAAADNPPDNCAMQMTIAIETLENVQKRLWVYPFLMFVGV